MSSAPVNRVDVFVTFPVSLYLEDDRVEIGTTNIVCQEEMTRIAYRDVRRIVTWPDRMVQYLYLERRNLLRTGFGVAIAALAIGFVFWRFITRPIYGLIASTNAISAGESPRSSTGFRSRCDPGSGQSGVCTAM